MQHDGSGVRVEGFTCLVQGRIGGSAHVSCCLALYCHWQSTISTCSSSLLQTTLTNRPQHDHCASVPFWRNSHASAVVTLPVQLQSWSVMTSWKTANQTFRVGCALRPPLITSGDTICKLIHWPIASVSIAAFRQALMSGYFPGIMITVNKNTAFHGRVIVMSCFLLLYPDAAQRSRNVPVRVNTPGIGHFPAMFILYGRQTLENVQTQFSGCFFQGHVWKQLK